MPTPKADFLYDTSLSRLCRHAPLMIAEQVVEKQTDRFPDVPEIIRCANALEPFLRGDARTFHQQRTA
jgi:hypothetical protein